MKLKRFLVTVISIFSITLTSGKQQSSVVAVAINSIIDIHFAKLSSQFPGSIKVVRFGDETEEFLLLMERLLKVKSAKVKIEIYQTNLNEFRVTGYIVGTDIYLEWYAIFQKNQE